MNTRPANIMNKAFRLLADREMLDLMNTRKGVLQKLGGKLTPAFESESKKLIENLLVKRNIPLSWTEPLYNTIWQEYVDEPLGDGVHVEIEGEVLTERTSHIYSDSNIFDEGDIPKAYSIVVTRNVSKPDLINFIEDRYDLLSKIQKQLRLPDDPTVGSRLTLYAFVVIILRDEGGKEFEEIASLLEEAISEDNEITENEKRKLLKTVSSADNVRKNLYDRFKRDYLRLKNSPNK